MGPASHPLPGLQSPPPQFTQLHHKEILPQINLPQNLPLVSNKPFTDFAVKNQDLLRAPPSTVPMGRRASDCGVYSSLVQGREEAECEAAEEMAAAADPGAMFCMLGGELEATAGLHYLGRDMRPATAPSVSYSPDSPRKRRTGLMTVMERPPDITDEVISDVESRILQQQQVYPPLLAAPLTSLHDSPASLSPLSPVSLPVTSPSHFSILGPSPAPSALARRGRQSCSRVSSLKEPHSLHLSQERYSPVRRLSEGAPLARAQHPPCSSATPSPSCDQSPGCELRAIQDEYRALNQETRLSIDSTSSGYHSPQYLCPPTPPGQHPALRRSSESNVVSGPGGGGGGGVLDAELLAAMYEDMYAAPQLPDPRTLGPVSRRSSYPNSPSHAAGSSREKQQILQQQFQQLGLGSGLGVRYKGSITQGVPSLAATTPTSGLTPVTTPKHLLRPSASAAANTASISSFDEAFSKQLNFTLFGSNYAPPHTQDQDYFHLADVEQSGLVQNPEISVTNVMGDEIKVVFTEPMDQSS